MSDETKPLCYDDCRYFILGIQANTKHNMYNCLITSLGSLLATERLLGPLRMPGWSPMKKEKIRKLIQNAGRAKNKCARDLKIINDTIKEGCPNCQLRSSLPALPEEFDDLQVDLAMPGPAPKPTPKPQ